MGTALNDATLFRKQLSRRPYRRVAAVPAAMYSCCASDGALQDWDSEFYGVLPLHQGMIVESVGGRVVPPGPYIPWQYTPGEMPPPSAFESCDYTR